MLNLHLLYYTSLRRNVRGNCNRNRLKIIRISILCLCWVFFCIVFVGLKQEIGKNERESRQQNFFISTEKKCQKTDEEKRQWRATEGEGMFNCFSQCV